MLAKFNGLDKDYMAILRLWRNLLASRFHGQSNRAHLHPIEGLAIPHPPPFSGLFPVPELHEHHIPIPSLCPDHPEVADLVSRLLSNEAEKIRGCKVRGYSKYAQRCTIFISEWKVNVLDLLESVPSVLRADVRFGFIVQARRLFSISI